MANSTLQTIQTKVRRLTRSLSESQLPTTDLNQYINTFVLYDFPEHLRLFNLHTNFTFYTEPYIDTYAPSTDPTNDLYDFNNIYTNFNPPCYIAGYQAVYMQSQNQFYGLYPKINAISSIGVTGDGTTTTFNGYINTQQQNLQPYVNNNSQGIVLLQNNVLFSAIDINNNGLALIDYPVSTSVGALGLPGVPQTALPSPYGQINYITGEFTINFPNPPQTGTAINSQVVPLQPSLPQTILFYDGQFVVRPIPDQPYRIQIEADMRPTELLASDQNPQLNEWWQYIAYGAAKKIFEDRMDLESVVQITPEFKKQENLVLRRTIVQNTTQRTSTIYDQDTNTGVGGVYGGQGFGGSGSF